MLDFKQSSEALKSRSEGMCLETLFSCAAAQGAQALLSLSPSHPCPCQLSFPPMPSSRPVPDLEHFHPSAFQKEKCRGALELPAPSCGFPVQKFRCSIRNPEHCSVLWDEHRVRWQELGQRFCQRFWHCAGAAAHWSQCGAALVSLELPSPDFSSPGQFCEF